MGAIEAEIPAAQPQCVAEDIVVIAIVAPGIPDRHGKPLPRSRRYVTMHSCVCEVLRSWAKDVLRLPERLLPGGATGGPQDLAEKGVHFSGQGGPLQMDR